MKKVILTLMCMLGISAISAQEKMEYSISGKIEGAARGDTLRFVTVSPDWLQMTPAFDIVVGRSGKVKYRGTHPHSQNYAYYYHPIDTTYKVHSSRRAGEVFITDGEIKIEGVRDYIYRPVLKGGVYDEELQLINQKENSIDKERDDIYKKLLSVDRKVDAELSKKYEEEFNSFYSQKHIMERGYEVKRLKKQYFTSNSNDYVALELLSSAGQIPMDSLEVLYNEQIQSVKDGYYGVELNNKISLLKSLEPQMPAPDFALTTITGAVITKESLLGKYVLIYHYGMCPGSLALDKRLSDWYEKHKERVEVIGYTSFRESVANIAKKTERGRKMMGIDMYEALQSMTNHPWRYEVDADFDDVNRELLKIYDIRSLPFFIFISPEGIILDRGSRTFYNGALKVVDATAKKTVRALNVDTQADYYTGKTEVIGEGVIYDCESVQGGNRIFTLKNRTNENMSYQLTYIDDTPATIPSRDYSKFRDRSVVREVIEEVFTADELSKLSKMSIARMMFFAKLHEDGSISNLKFLFFANPVMLSISPDRFYKMEKELLSRVKFDVDPKMLNGVNGYYKYLTTTFGINFKDMSIE